MPPGPPVYKQLCPGCRKGWKGWRVPFTVIPEGHFPLYGGAIWKVPALFSPPSSAHHRGCPPPEAVVSFPLGEETQLPTSTRLLYLANPRGPGASQC